MREAINENRTVQLALLGVLALAGALLLLMAKSGGGEEAATSTPPVAGQPAAAAPVATTDPSALASTPTTAPTGAGASVPVGLIPGPSLPQGLLSAYRNGDAVALLVRRAGGRDDVLVRDSVEGLSSLPGVEVYVTKAKGISRYAWLTQAVNVTDLPALVVLRPRKLSGGKPTATVTYGFRGSGSVVQAVKDQLYRGPTGKPYHP